MWKRTELRPQKGQNQIWKSAAPSMATHPGTWQIALRWMEPLATAEAWMPGKWSPWQRWSKPWGAGNEFELRYRRAFSDLTSQLHITPGTAYQSFEQVVNELFRDGVNWGRIVAFFSFGGALCVESVDKEMQVLVSRIATWMATYLNDHLEPWIQENGGWVRTTPLVYSFSLASGQIPSNLSPVSLLCWVIIIVC